MSHQLQNGSSGSTPTQPTFGSSMNAISESKQIGNLSGGSGYSPAIKSREVRDRERLRTDASPAIPPPVATPARASQRTHPYGTLPSPQQAQYGSRGGSNIAVIDAPMSNTMKRASGRGTPLLGTGEFERRNVTGQQPQPVLQPINGQGFVAPEEEPVKRSGLMRLLCCG